MTGLRFGRLRVLGRSARRGAADAWLCRCSCGERVVVTSGSLRAGRISSCCKCRRQERCPGCGGPVESNRLLCQACQPQPKRKLLADRPERRRQCPCCGKSKPLSGFKQGPGPRICRACLDPKHAGEKVCRLCAGMSHRVWPEQEGARCRRCGTAYHPLDPVRLDVDSRRPGQLAALYLDG